MVYPLAHALITVFGDGWTESEQWQWGVRALPVAPFDDADCQAVANTLAAPTQTYFQDAANMDISPNMRLLGIKVARIGVDGKYPPDHAPGIYNYVGSINGAGSGTAFPQCSIAVTLGTNKPRGRAHKGRYYLPPQTIAPGADGRILAAFADNIANASKTWLDAVNAVAELEGVVVMSKLDAGTYEFVRNVQVGRVVDTIRSRRAKLPEERVSVPLA